MGVAWEGVGLGAASVLVAADLAVFTLVTCLVLKLGYTMESLGEFKKNSWGLGPPTGSDFISLGFSMAVGTLTRSAASLMCGHVGKASL